MAENDKTKLQQWTQRIKDWESSGVTQRAYCEREGLKYGTFDYWHRQIRSSGAAVRPRTTPASTKCLTLVPVHLSGQALSESMRLHSPGGWQLALPVTVDAAWLASLLRQLS